jgi:hypothetical protein
MIRFYQLTKAQYNQVKEEPGVAVAGNKASPTQYVASSPDELEVGTEITREEARDLVVLWKPTNSNALEP